MSQMFGSQVIGQFVSDVCSSWGKISEVKSVDVEDTGTVYALKLRKMTQASQGIMKKFLASFLTLTPHSMATERLVIKSVKRSSLHQETINGVMNISLNGIGTAYFDPRPAVFTFLKKKDRRNAQPCSELYKQRDFVRKFFQSDNGCL